MYRSQKEVTEFALHGVTFGEMVAGDAVIRMDGSGGTPPPPAPGTPGGPTVPVPPPPPGSPKEGGNND